MSKWPHILNNIILIHVVIFLVYQEQAITVSHPYYRIRPKKKCGAALNGKTTHF
jgi:hypothetical protein